MITEERLVELETLHRKDSIPMRVELKELAAAYRAIGREYIDVVFDGPPSHEAGRFVEAEDASGKSIKAGEWIQRPDGYWALRLPRVIP